MPAMFAEDWETVIADRQKEDEMEINRFDKVEFEVLEAAHGIGYYPQGENADRALILMVEGIIVSSPQENWNKSGWKLTDDGAKYYDEFIRQMREKHGHVWMTLSDSDPEYYDENDEYGNEIDIFAYSSGYCNGMVCKNCGFSFCKHCDSEFEIDKCTNNPLLRS